MTIFHAIILGIVEGITEFLPISSTGHLILVSELLNLGKTAFLSSFEIGIQLGAIFAVVFIYFKRVFAQKILFKTVAIAFIPAAVIGLFAYKFIKSYLLGNAQVVLWSLFVGGIVLIIFEYFHKEKSAVVQEVSQINSKQAIIIGFFQCLAMIPGVSRSAATIIGGLTLGIGRKAIVEFSFLLAIPTMLAATSLDLFKTGASFAGREWLLLAAGFVSSFIVAWFSVKWLIKFIQNHSFIGFGIYRIIIAILFWLILL
ncbi:MAG: undecaprenyl-diphosphate phosphatase [Candidatus Magasanikbacteria bacterium]|nr:undecaprenyl-diphosphate phosphatase [Candidatus Magasanikbacteria bacterium]